MTRAAGTTAAAAPAADGASDAARLRRASRQLTGVFAQQLFKAMRDTVPQGEGAFSGGSGEEMFTGMLDEHLAGVDPATNPASPAAGDAGIAFTRGLADAVFRRLRARAGREDQAPAAPGTVTPPAGPASLAQPTLRTPAAPLVPAAPLGPLIRR